MIDVSTIMLPNHLNDEGDCILVNKPLDWTSFDVVARVRKMLAIKKIGHAGTLDPKATGLLILCTGKMTKRISDFIDLRKEYYGTMELGATTSSFDSETEIVEKKEFREITETQIRNTFTSFLGIQKQLPPMYSAIKVNGRRLYKSARKGKEVFRPVREIEVDFFELLNFTPPSVSFRVRCSKGTYVRSLVHDVGQKLGCGAYLTSLCRTKIGNFSVEDALEIQQIEEFADQLVEVLS